ncbi:arylamine N-acetyltransferase [Streptomyces sp. NPDC089919]|uniref:arylamine N-acetyltransferase family protein n=1 Tax=Streptomyces sp. NPDC089919 TaxID=3155188 RepID=UPI0034182CE4
MTAGPPAALSEAQIAAYLGRLGLDRPERADAAALAALQDAHLRAVPFENLSIHLGEPIVLDPDALFEKVVTGRRGGFCYELNGLFAALLEGLGFRVSRLAAQVFGPERAGPPFDHMALRVDLAEVWLADVGFGRFSRYPLRLDERGEQHDPAGVFTVRPYEDQLDVLLDGQPQYRLDLRPYALADFAPTCWWQATWPRSHFRRAPMCSRLTADGGRSTLSGSRLIVTSAAGERSERELAGAELLDAYRTEFGVDLPRLPGPAGARAGGRGAPAPRRPGPPIGGVGSGHLG